jgi:peptide methionine sulfoxide reductase MsrB
MDTRIEKTDEQWRKELTPAEYKVLRRKGTERPALKLDTNTAR